MTTATKKRGKWLRWLIPPVLAGALAIGYYEIKTPNVQSESVQQDYSEWWKQHLSKSSGKRFHHEAFLKEYAPTNKEIEEYDARVRSKYGDATIISRKFREGPYFVSLAIDNAVWHEYTARETDAIKELLAYAGISKFPLIYWRQLDQDSIPEKPKDDYIPVHVVYAMPDDKFATYEIEQGGKTMSFNVGGYSSGPSGATQIVTTVTPTSKGFIASEKIMPIVVAVGDSSIECYTSPPAEVFHFVLRKARFNPSLEDINNMCDTADSTNNVLKEKVNQILFEWLKREEGVVHSILDDFLTKHGLFSPDEREGYFTHSNKPNYELVPQMREMLKTMSPTELTRRYLENPRTLFDECTDKTQKFK